MTRVTIMVEENNMDPELCATMEWCGKKEKDWDGQRRGVRAQLTPYSKAGTVQ